MKSLLDMNVLKNGSEVINSSSEIVEVIPNEEEAQKRKRGRPRKSESQNNTDNAIIVKNNNSNINSVPMCQSSEPYENTYNETNDMLRVSIMQLDILANDVKGEIDNIRSSKTLKGKYKYISDLCATASSLVSTKVSAIKEINAVKTNCHKLEIQRIKDVKSAISNQQDDDKYIADLYNAYINIPINAQQNPALQYNSANVAGNMNALMSGINTSPVNEEQNFNNYMNNLTPEQNRMILGDNPNIETVVVYDPNTGDKMFDVIDNRTGCPVPNYPRPDRSLLDDTSIDFGTGIASNTNIGQNWKVVVIGDMINKF